MNLKTTFPALLFGLTTLCTSCNKNVTKIAAKKHMIENDAQFQKLLKDTFSTKYSDEQKIISFNTINQVYNGNCSNYIIVDKKNCQAKVYTPLGHLLYKTEVALGRNIGDKRSGGYMVPGAKLAAYTTPGEYIIAKEGSKNSKNIKLYGQRVLPLIGDHTQEAYKQSQSLALHRVPKTPMGKLRENVFNNKTLKDNRVSFGCVNFLTESYDKMRKLISGKGTKVYILPEEKGNSLHLERQKDGNYKFFQTKYRYESQEKQLNKKMR